MNMFSSVELSLRVSLAPVNDNNVLPVRSFTPALFCLTRPLSVGDCSQPALALGAFRAALYVLALTFLLPSRKRIITLLYPCPPAGLP